ncbi:unnamed protein product [Parnassius apollo]|uniref:(apollo) hypothetical protein n=1 Tax=Parnassius apollo TaxID=110799 RepID=A0A8S3W1S4_PARAO|nr:unnamed protein product [Parnassius apollo]
MGVSKNEKQSSGVWTPQRMSCYMGSGCSYISEEDSCSNNKKRSCHHHRTGPDTNPTCSSYYSMCPSVGSRKPPLIKVLGNLKEAASFEKSCTVKLNDLLNTEEQLNKALQNLEQREKEGMKLLKQADSIWLSMEEAYKKKVSESLERQKLLRKQLREIEISTTKWRKNLKDLESQLNDVNKCQEEMKGKIAQKSNDIKCIDMEIADLQKRLDNNKNEVEATKKTIVMNKEASNKKVANLAEEAKRLEKVVAEEKKIKRDKELEGTKLIKEAREDVKVISEVLLKKKLENDDLRAEKATLLSEIEFLEQARDLCKDKCNLKQSTLENEIKKIDAEIAECKIKCIKCNECTDTSEIQKFCTDCPRCLEGRRCIVENDHCSMDHTMDCVCMTVKRKFLDNVFENMYNVLVRQVKEGAGKVVAEKVFNCLKRSRNGKLDGRTRKILQEFILTSVKRHLNLTIVGGAVKTRCEAPCSRWGGTNECNCPKGPKGCICMKKAPPPIHDPTPCPQEDENKEDEDDVKFCPLDCGMHGMKTSPINEEFPKWRADPCRDPSCKYSKNMRTARCVVDPDCSASIPTKDYGLGVVNKNICDCVNIPKDHTTHRPDNGARSHPRELLIDEVMGNNDDVTIERISSIISSDSSTTMA